MNQADTKSSALYGHEIKVLNHGHVRVVDTMGADTRGAIHFRGK